MNTKALYIGQARRFQDRMNQENLEIARYQKKKVFKDRKASGTGKTSPKNLRDRETYMTAYSAKIGVQKWVMMPICQTRVDQLDQTENRYIKLFQSRLNWQNYRHTNTAGLTTQSRRRPSGVRKSNPNMRQRRRETSEKDANQIPLGKRWRVLPSMTTHRTGQ